MNCPKCGSVNSEGTNFCTNCGHNIGNMNNQSSITSVPIEHGRSEENLNVQGADNLVNYGQVNNSVVTEGLTNNTNLTSNNDGVTINNIINNNDINSTVVNDKKSINKKLIFILIGVGILIVIVIVVILLFSKKDDLSNDIDYSYMFSSSNPIPVLKDGKYGYITQDGEMLLEPIYNTIGEFYEGYAAVSIDNPDTTANNESIYLIIDKEGNIVNDYEIYSQPEYYPEYKIWIIDSELYDSSINKISPENLEVSYLDDGYLMWRNDDLDTSGIMNKDGKVTYTYAPDTDGYVYAMYSISKNVDLFEESYCKINVNNEEYAIINCETGKIVYDFTEYYIADGTNNIFRISDHDTFKNIMTVYLYNDKVLYQTTNSGSMSYESDGYIEIKDGVTKYIDVKSGKIVNQKPDIGDYDIDEIDLMNESVYGYRIIGSYGSYGLVSNNKEIIPSEYDDIEFLDSDLFNYIKKEFGQELVLLEQDDKTQLMNIKDKKVITSFDSTMVEQSENSSFLKISLYEESKYSRSGYMIYNVLSGKSMKFDTQNKITIKSNYITVENDMQVIYYNNDLEQIYEEDVRHG